MPFFSVIIPLYNKEKYIEATINSVLTQTFIDYEIIIINDGSTDKSLKKISKYNEQDNITIINQNNSGLSFSRNKGFSLSKGNVIAFLDADDIWHPSFLRVIKSLHDNYPKAVIYGSSYFEIRNHKRLEINVNIDNKLKNTSFILEDFFKANIKQFIPCQSSIALKKESFDKPPFNEKITYHEDVDFYLKYCEMYKVAIMYKPLVDVYFSVKNQMSQSNISNKKLPDLNFYQELYKKNKSIQKYIDTQRYKLGIKYCLEKNNIQKKIIQKKIDFSNLTLQQNILLKSPLILLKTIKSVKKMFLKYNIRLTTF